MAAGREGQRTAINENDIYGAKLDVARAKCQRATIQNKYRPRSIYQYSNMDLNLSGQTSIFGGVFFVFKSLLAIESQNKLLKKIIFDPKASEPCQNIDISNVAKHRVMFVHVTFFVVKYSKCQMS